MEYGFEVTILEARDYCGGRIRTDYSMGIPLGLGASWIHGKESNPIAELAQQFDAKIIAADPGQFVFYDQNNNPISQHDIQKFNERFELLLSEAKKLAFQSKEDISLADALSKFITLDQLTPLEQALFKSKILFFEGYIGANYESLSARYWDAEEAIPGENCYVLSSYQPILEGLSSNCSIEFNTVVTEINTKKDRVEIKAGNANFDADMVLITVPLGVLKKNHINFHPPLPESKQKAIQKLGMGIFNITAIKFAKPFWPKEPHAFFFTQFDDLSIPVFFNLHHFNEQAMLLGYSGGDRARRLEKMSDEELIEKTIQNFRTCYGINLPEPEAMVNTRWLSDSFSYGSYSYLPVGASNADYDLMSIPVDNKLFFAGEATHSKYPATTHGAFLSGIREAERIKNIFG
jgi:monoamine oxidase